MSRARAKFSRVTVWLSRSALLLAGMCSLLGGACAQKPYPREPVVEELTIEGLDGVDLERLREGLATQESQRLLLIWDGVAHDYETLDQAVLRTDLERIERFLRARGYYEARVTTARVTRTDEHHVRVEVTVDRGSPVLTRSLRLTGVEKVDIDAATKTLTAIRLERDQPFDEDGFEASKDNIANTLADNGYAYSKVEGEVQVDVVERAADVVFRVSPGPKARFGPIRIAGLKEIPEEPIREALQLEPGDSYSRAELEQARRAVFDLGVFSRVVVDQDLSDEANAVVPVTFRLTETNLKSLTLGIGGRIDVSRTTGYLKSSWEHRNFLGGLRRFTVSERPGLTAYPTRIDFLERPTRPLFENDLDIELRQPSFIEGRTTGWTRARYSIYPLLYPLADIANAKTEPIIGYHDVGTSVGLDRSFFEHYIPASLSYHWNANIPRVYQNADISQLDNVYVSYPQLSVALDLRDDPVAPVQGIYLSGTLQVANPLLWGSVSDFRVQSGLRTFYPLSRKHDIVLATRVKLGFVFPSNYGNTFDTGNDASRELFDNPEDPAVVEDQQKILFRTFYSGGPNSNRGYAYRQVGPQGPIGFLLPDLRSGECDPSMATSTLPAECLRALGGFSLWEASVEVRFPLLGELYGTLFVDTSDVDSNVATLGVDSPHLSVGPGLRYRTPIGPIRLDVGYRVPGWQVRGSTGTPPRYFPDIAELPEFRARAPFAYHIAIGEAF